MNNPFNVIGQAFEPRNTNDISEGSRCGNESGLWTAQLDGFVGTSVFFRTPSSWKKGYAVLYIASPSSPLTISALNFDDDQGNHPLQLKGSCSFSSYRWTVSSHSESHDNAVLFQSDRPVEIVVGLYAVSTQAYASETDDTSGSNKPSASKTTAVPTTLTVKSESLTASVVTPSSTPHPPISSVVGPGQSNRPDSSSRRSHIGGLIAGSIIAAVVILVLLSLAIRVCWRKILKHRNQRGYMMNPFPPREAEPSLLRDETTHIHAKLHALFPEIDGEKGDERVSRVAHMSPLRTPSVALSTPGTGVTSLEERRGVVELHAAMRRAGLTVQTLIGSLSQPRQEVNNPPMYEA